MVTYLKFNYLLCFSRTILPVTVTVVSYRNDSQELDITFI